VFSLILKTLINPRNSWNKGLISPYCNLFMFHSFSVWEPQLFVRLELSLDTSVGQCGSAGHVFHVALHVEIRQLATRLKLVAPTNWYYGAEVGKLVPQFIRFHTNCDNS
jgi:hypothetical protein